MQLPSMSFRSSHPRSLARASSAASSALSLAFVVSFGLGMETDGIEQRKGRPFRIMDSYELGVSEAEPADLPSGEMGLESSAGA